MSKRLSIIEPKLQMACFRHLPQREPDFGVTTVNHDLSELSASAGEPS